MCVGSESWATARSYNVTSSLSSPTIPVVTVSSSFVWEVAMVGFRVGTVVDGDVSKWSPRVLQDGLRKALRNRIRDDGRYRFKPEGGKWGPVKSRSDVIGRVVAWAADVTEAGHRVYIRNVDTGTVWVVRSVRYPIPDKTNGNSKVDLLVFIANREGFSDLESWGVTVCRNIGSTSTKSQHTNWAPTRSWKSMGYSSYEGSAGGNAIDVHFDSFRRMDEFAKWCVRNMDRFDIQTVIWNLQVITADRRYWRTYNVPPGGSTHKDHVHVDFRPSRSGDDRCG